MARVKRESCGHTRRASTRRCRSGDRLRRLAGTVEPRQIRLFAKPDQLPPRVAPVLLHDERARRRLVAHAVQMLEGLPIDQTAERPGVFRNAAREQRSGSRRAGRARTARPRARDAPRSLGRRQPDCHRVDRRCRQWATRCRRNARSAAARSGRTPRAPARAACDRAAECAPPTPDPRAAPCGAGTPRLAGRQSPRAARAAPASRAGPGKQAAGQRPIVEPGAADDESAAGRARECRGSPRQRRARSCAAVYSSVGSTMSIRWCGMPRRSADRHLVGADVEAAIDRGRVAVDDLAAEPLGQRQRQRALAGRGRPEHGRRRLPTVPRAMTSTTNATSRISRPSCCGGEHSKVQAVPSCSLQASASALDLARA